MKSFEQMWRCDRCGEEVLPICTGCPCCGLERPARRASRSLFDVKRCELLEDGRLLVCKNHEAIERLTEAAAFLDEVAERMDSWVRWSSGEGDLAGFIAAAADCRAMAQKLRK